jgi:NDP-sugar pyrophosphorylase family protein
MKAVILAGGKGIRLYPISKNTPKALIEIGGKPVIEHQILLLREHGIREIFVLSGYLGDKIKDYLQNKKKWNVKIHCYREKTPLGTAGALKTLDNKIKEDFLVLSGDVMMNFDLKRFINYHRQKKGIASIIVHPTDHPFDSDLVEVDDTERITNFLIRPHPEGKILPDLSIASVFIFSPEIFQYIPKKKKSDIEKDILPLILKSKVEIYGYNTSDYIKDIGTPERLRKVQEDYILGKIT